MSDNEVGRPNPVSFGERLAASQAFAVLFQDGMSLVEEAASYLDGPGRKESKHLGRSAALTYATESMRLTTRLMQLASWLLLHRAVNEGEMSLSEAGRDKVKVKLLGLDRSDDAAINQLPEHLQVLINRSLTLQRRIRRLDATIHAADIDKGPHANQVKHQLGLLKAAFERAIQ